MRKRFLLFVALILLAALLFLSPEKLRAQAPTNGLIAYFRLDGDTQDSSVLGTSAVIQGSAQYVQDRFRNDSGAIMFGDPSGNLIYGRSWGSLPAFTVAFWYRKDVSPLTGSVFRLQTQTTVSLSTSTSSLSTSTPSPSSVNSLSTSTDSLSTATNNTPALSTITTNAVSSLSSATTSSTDELSGATILALSHLPTSLGPLSTLDPSLGSLSTLSTSSSFIASLSTAVSQADITLDTVVDASFQIGTSSPHTVSLGYSATPSQPKDSWYHLVATHDATGAVAKLFIDGEEVASTQDGGGLMLQNGIVTIVGRSGVTMDDVRVYNRALSVDEVKRLYFSEAFTEEDRAFLANNPTAMGFHSQAAFDANRTNGQTDVATNPSAFGLFTQTEMNDSRNAGRSDVVNNPTNYNLFTEAMMMDMHLGGVVLKQGTNANSLDLELTIESKDNLSTNGWQIAERILRVVSTEGGRKFLRVRAGPPYVAPSVKVLSHQILGNILTDAAGRVLYFLSFDSPGANPLYSGSSWPYVTSPSAPKADLGVNTTLGSSTFGRTDGPFLTVNNRPAYFYAGDSAPGQANGHAAGGVWYTIKVDGTINW